MILVVFKKKSISNLNLIRKKNSLAKVIFGKQNKKWIVKSLILPSKGIDSIIRKPKKKKKNIRCANSKSSTTESNNEIES